MASAGTRVIANATIITVSQQAPPQTLAGDVEVDEFTSGGRRILSIDCTPTNQFYASLAQQAALSEIDNVKKESEPEPDDDDDDATKDDLNLMDVDSKADVSKITKKFKKIGEGGGGGDGDDDEGLGYLPPADDSPDGLLVAYIKRIVHEDLQRPSSERIDTVHIKSPERHHWLALNGLSPKHLTLSTCNVDRGELASLDRLEQRWTELETLRLEDISDTLWDPEDWATTVSSVHSITIAYCKSVRLVPTSKFPHLTKLRIVENDALAMFVLAGEKVTGFSKRLEVLHLQSTNGRDAKSKPALRRFWDRLRKCTHVRDLTLILARANLDTELSQYIPSSVENLKFHCSCSLTMLEDLQDEWLKKPADRKWLPKLQSFTFRADARTFDHRRNQRDENVSRILDVPVPPKEEEGDTSLDLGDISTDSIDIDPEVRKVMGPEDIDDDDDDDADYEEPSFEEEDDKEDDSEEEDEDETEVKMEEDDDDDDNLEIAAPDEHNPILLPHIASIIGTVLHRLKERNPELTIIG